MPRVPTYEGGQVRATVQPNVQQSDNGADPRDFGAGQGEALQRFGAVATHVVNLERERVDSAALLDAQSQLSQAENKFTDPNNPEGLYAHKGADALKAGDKLLPEYDRIAGEIEAKLPSQRAREMFARQRLQRRDGFQGQIQSYAVREKEQYEAQSFDAFTTSGTSDLARALSEGDPRSADYEANLVAGIDAYATAQGWPSQQRALASEKAVSVAYRNVIERTAAQDPVAAQALLQRYGTKLRFEDSSELLDKLQPAADYAIAEAAVEHVLTGGVQPGAVTTNSDQLADKLLPCIRRLETGSLPNAATATSSAGAIGLHQLLPETARAAAKRLGVPFHPDDLTDPAKNTALAREELRFLCDKFGNDEAAVLAAYNMGPAAAEGWAAGKPYQTQSGKTWTPRYPKDPAAMPTETRDYVRKGLSGGPAPAKGEARLAVLDLPTLTPAQQKIASTLVRQREIAIAEQRKAADEQTEQGIWTKVEQAPAGVSLRAVLSPDELAWAQAHGKADTFETRMANRGEVHTDPSTLATLETVFYQAGLGDTKAIAKVRGLNLVEYYDRLSPADRKTFAEQQTALINPKDKKGAEFADENELLQQSYARMGWVGEGKEPAANKAAFRAGYTTLKQEFFEQHKRNPNPDEARKLMNALAVRKATHVGGELPLYARLNRTASTMQVPAIDERQIRAAAARHGKTLTSQQVLRIYAATLGGGK